MSIEFGKLSFLDVVVFAIGLIHLIPFAIAFVRRHNRKWLVLLVSLVPFIGFFIGLVWAFVGKAQGLKVERQNA
jgi:hypothetical protein